MSTDLTKMLYIFLFFFLSRYFHPPIECVLRFSNKTKWRKGNFSQRKKEEEEKKKIPRHALLHIKRLYKHNHTYKYINM